MKKYSLIFLSTLAMCLLLVSCNKSVYKYNADFQGKWQTIPVYDSLLTSTTMSEILIDGEDGSFKNSCNPCANQELCNCISVQIGKAVMNTSKTHMKIGSSNSYQLRIDEEPKVGANGVWTMKIQGLQYFRQ